uniref:Uncharacterized protein n=1 Tax=Oryza meridionalis TaxID=40149 RepID=A0A0E0F3Y1_9ORYZ
MLQEDESSDEVFMRQMLRIISWYLLEQTGCLLQPM